MSLRKDARTRPLKLPDREAVSNSAPSPQMSKSSRLITVLDSALRTLLWRSRRLRGISTTIFLREVAVLGGIIKRSRDDVAAFLAGYKIGAIETIRIKAVWTGIIVEGADFFFLPAFKGFLDRWKGAEIE